jgi:hypothetical protein
MNNGGKISFHVKRKAHTADEDLVIIHAQVKDLVHYNSMPYQLSWGSMQYTTTT